MRSQRILGCRTCGDLNNDSSHPTHQRVRNNLQTLYRFGDNSINLHGWRGSDEFCGFYPFHTYQFDLFQLAIRQLSEHGIFTGKYLSVGERSMLAVFQEVAKSVRNEDQALRTVRVSVKSRAEEDRATVASAKPVLRFRVDRAIAGGWDKRTLERQIHSFCYERLLKSQQPQKMLANGRQTLTSQEPAIESLKNPYVLEFLRLPEVAALHETDLEAAILSYLQAFLLELGNGFAFVARQKRLRFEDDDRYVDLVFYHCQLKFYLLIDLKLGELTHKDVGQMDGYVRMFDDLCVGEGDNRTFSRGIEQLTTEASMVFMGNTKNSVAYMLKHSNFFEPLPDKYIDSAFLDRIHACLRL